MAEFNDFGDGDDSGEHDIETDISLDSIEHSKTINYSIRANYTTWKPREAFRELVQNWSVPSHLPFPFPFILAWHAFGPVHCISSPHS
jgi:hypothetical protein